MSYEKIKDDSVIEKGGKKTENLHRDNIEQKDFDALNEALNNGNYSKAIEIIAKIVAGDEVVNQ